MDFVYFPLIKLEENRFTKDFESPYTNRNPQGRFGIQFWKFHNLRKNGKADKIHFTVLCRWRDTHRLLSWAFPIICLEEIVVMGADLIDYKDYFYSNTETDNKIDIDYFDTLLAMNQKAEG